MKKTIVILSEVVFDNSPYCIFVHEHAKALVKQGYNVFVFAMLKWFPFASFLRKERKEYYSKMKGMQVIDGVSVIYKKVLTFSNVFYDSTINLNGISYYLSIQNKVKKILKQNAVMYIDAHMFKMEGYVAARLKKKFSIPAIVTCHGTSFFRTLTCKNSKKIVKGIADNIDCMVGVSEVFKRCLEQYDVHNIETIYNGVHFYSSLYKENSKKKNSIITIGSFIKRKNINVVIEAFSKIKIEVPDAILTIVGSGMEEQYLKELVQKNNLQQSIIFTGQIENGYLVIPQAEEIASKITEILENPEKMESIRQKGKKSTESLSWEQNAKNYIALVQRIQKEERI